MLSRLSMGRSSSRSKRSSTRKESSGAGAPGTSSKDLLAEARRLSQQASRKQEGPIRSSVLKTCGELFRSSLSLPLSPAEREEALFDLGQVLLELCGSLQAGLGHLAGFLDGSLSKDQAIEAQVQTWIVAAGICRESAEAFENVRSMKGQFEQEALVNSGVAITDWAELVLEIPETNGGGVGLAKELLLQAHQRYSAALQVAPVDVELLVNYADCCVRMAELEADNPKPSLSPSQFGQTEAVRRLYDQGLDAYAFGCANADGRLGDDLSGLLHNWGSALFSAAQRSSDLDEAFKFVCNGQEKFASAIKFRAADISNRIRLGECLAGFVDEVNGRVTATQQMLEFLRVACDEGYGGALKIDSVSPAALLGLGDAQLTAGKLLKKQGLYSQAHKHFDESATSFHQAFEILKNDVGNRANFKYDELCDSLYNYACAAALRNHETKAVECLEHLLSLDALSLEEAAQDPDLAALEVFFQSKISAGMLEKGASLIGLPSFVAQNDGRAVV